MTFTPCRTPAPCIRTRADGSLCQVLNETGFDGVWMRGRPALSHDAEPSRPQPNSRRLDLWCVSSERATCERVRAPAGLHLVLLNLRCGFKPLQLQAFSSCNNTYRSQNNYKQLQRLHIPSNFIEATGEISIGWGKETLFVVFYQWGWTSV